MSEEVDSREEADGEEGLRPRRGSLWEYVGNGLC